MPTIQLQAEWGENIDAREGNRMADESALAKRPGPSATLTMILQARAIEARVETELSAFDLSIRRVGILGHLRASPGISFSALARRAGIKVQSLHPIVGALVELGLVSTIGDVEQGRAAAIELTAKGEKALRQSAELFSALDEEFFARGDRKELGDVLVRIAEAFTQDRSTSLNSAG